MAKILRGRISGFEGMEPHSATELQEWADRFASLSDSDYPARIDDPKWLRRWAKRLHCLAEQKAKAREQKCQERHEVRRSQRS